MKMFIVIGTLGTAVMMLLSHQFAFLNGVAGSYLSIIAVAPTLFLVCVASAMRGYFQGFQEMRPTAVSQIMETLGKLLMGILLALGARESSATGLRCRLPAPLPDLPSEPRSECCFCSSQSCASTRRSMLSRGLSAAGKISGGRGDSAQIARHSHSDNGQLFHHESYYDGRRYDNQLAVDEHRLCRGVRERSVRKLYRLCRSVCQPPARTYLSHILFTHSAAQGHSYPWRQQAQRGDMPQLSARYRDSGAAVHAPVSACSPSLC